MCVFVCFLFFVYFTEGCDAAVVLKRRAFRGLETCGAERYAEVVFMVPDLSLEWRFVSWETLC